MGPILYTIIYLGRSLPDSYDKWDWVGFDVLF